MGLGDWIMASGEAKAHHARTGRRVVFMGPRGEAFWSEVFDWNPKISRAQGHDVDIIRQGGGARPYIKMKTQRQWFWRPYQPIPGEIFFTEQEEEFGQHFKGRVIIEPNVKAIGHWNKDWGRARWQELARLAKDLPLAQFVAPKGSNPIPGVEQIGTERFRDAAAVLKYARGAVLPEGGLHHAAAAVGLPAVVIFGGFIAPKVTGYSMHRNLFTGGPPYLKSDLGCGMRTPCSHCKEAMARIPTELVVSELRSLL